MDREVFKARLVPFGTTLSDWTAQNPIPYQGEFVFEAGATPTDFKFKIGDGLTPYLSLPYQSSGGSGTATLQAVLLAGNSASHPNNIINLRDGSDAVMNLDDSTIEFIDTGDHLIYFSAGLDATAGNGFLIVGNAPSTSQLGQNYISSSATANRANILPDKSGTFAMLSDITSGGGNLQSVLNAGRNATNAGGGVNGMTLINTRGNSMFIADDSIQINNSSTTNRMAAIGVDFTSHYTYLELAPDDSIPSNHSVQVRAQNITQNCILQLPNVIQGIIALQGSGVAVACSFGGAPGLGTGATSTVSSSADERKGQITFHTGTGSAPLTKCAVITFATPLPTGANPIVLVQTIQVTGSVTQLLYALNPSTTGFELWSGNTALPSSGSSITLTYIVQW